MNAEDLHSVLHTSMALTCASLLLQKKKITAEEQERFKKYLRQHVMGLKKNFPGFMLPTHHLAFHIADGIDLFSTTPNASCWGSERLVGRLQDIPINHQLGAQLCGYLTPRTHTIHDRAS